MKKAMFVAVAAIAITARGAINVTASRDYVDKKVCTLQTNLEERIESAQPGNYSVVSNKAMNALQENTGGTIYGSLTVQKIGNPFTIRDWDSDHDFYDLIFGIYSDKWGFKHKAVGVDVDDPYIAYLPEKTGTIAFDDDVSGALGNATNYTDNATNNLAKVAHSGSYSDLSDKPTKLSQFQNDSGFITASTAPVKTVNSKTGVVVLNALDVGAIPTTGGVFQTARLHLGSRLSVGTWTDSVQPFGQISGSGIAFAFGDNVHSEAANTMTLGVGALNTNAWSFIWNGDANRAYYPTIPSMSNPYSTRFNGGFFINPSVRTGMTNPLQNFWIGDTNLNDWISILAPAPDLSGYLPKTGGEVTGDITFRTSSGLLGGSYLKISKDGFETGVAGTPNPKTFSLPDKSGTLTLLSDLDTCIRTTTTNALDMQVMEGVLRIDEADGYGKLYLSGKSSFGMSGGMIYFSNGGSGLAITPEGVYRMSPGNFKEGLISFPTNSGTVALTSNLQGYLPLDYFRDGQTIPMYWGDGTKLCDFGANWIGNLAQEVQNNSDAIDAIGNYSVVSNRAMSAIQNSGTQVIDGVLEIYNSHSPNPPMERIKLYVDDDGVCHLGIDGIADYVIPLNLSGGTLALTSDITNRVAFADAGAAIPSTGICLALAENYAYVTNSEEVVVGNVTNIVTTVTTNSYPVIALYKDGTKIWTSDPADESNIGWLVGLILALVGGAGTVLWRYFSKSKYTLKIDPDTGSIYYETED